MKTDTQSQNPQRQYLNDYKSPDYKVNNVHLSFDLHETKTKVKSRLNIKKLKDSVFRLNGENLNLLSIKMDSKILSTSDYAIDTESLTIHVVPSEFVLEIEVEINPQENKSCEGLYLSSGIFCTQCEAESFRKITYFFDRPDVMTQYTVEIEADEKKYPHLLSNGDCIEKQSLGNGRHRALWKDPYAKPSYLFALVAGDMGVIQDNFMTKSGRKVKLEVYAPHGKQNRCYHAMESLKKSMQWDEERFGLEYDLNQYMIVSIDDFNMGAMENKGLNIFNSRLVLADTESATDHDFEMIESVVGHEYFHNWSGNRVTCRNWFELSLKEGLTVFRDQEFSADMNSRSVQRIKDVNALRSRQFSEDAGPNAHAVRPDSCLAVDNFYTATIYEKGAEVIRMMQTIVGREGFKKGIQNYFTKYDGQAVTIIDFAQTIADSNNVNFDQFKLWYSQAGTPIVEVIEHYDMNNQTYTIKLLQSCPLTLKEKESLFSKKPFHIPLAMGLIDQNGSELTEHNLILNLKESEQTWVFKNIKNRPILSLNRNFSAPIKLKWQRSNQDLIHLIKYDTDDFNRREACSKMLMDELLRLIQAYQDNTVLTPQHEVIQALGTILSNDQLDPQTKSLILSLPSTDEIAQEMTIVDPIAIHLAQTEILRSFNKVYASEINSVYHQHAHKQTIGDRALKNKLLQIMSATLSEETLLKARDQFQNAKCMTDKLGALSVLCEYDNIETENALSAFHQKWKSDSVVFNKWLLVQATSSHAATFSRVLKATKTEGFDKNNPNNLYSLHAAFSRNLLRFHDELQNVYNWYSQELLRIDAINPQVAARLAQGFSLTQKLPATLKNKAVTEIKKLLEHTQLSKNARELLEKCI